MHPTWRPVLAGLVSLILAAENASAESLLEAWSIALANNPRFAATRWQEAAAHHESNAIAAERFPEFSLKGSYTLRSDEPRFRIQEPLPGFGTFEFPFAQRDAGAAAAHLRWPLYTSGRIKSAVLGAEARLEAARYDVDWARLRLLYAVGEAYLNVLKAEREVQVAENDLASLNAHGANVSRRFAEQRVSKTESLAAQVATAAARQRLLVQVHARDQARALYNRLLGRPLAGAVRLEEVTLPLMRQGLQNLTQVAWKQRPDLLSLMAVADSREFESRRLRAARLPQVNLTGKYEYEENRFGNPQGLGTAAIVVDWNLFDGGAKKQSAAAERSRAASIGQVVEDLKSQIGLDLLHAWNARHEATERLTVTRQKLAHAQESLRVSQLRYARGLSVSAEVLAAQTRWTEASRDNHRAAYDRVAAQLRLRHMAGILDPACAVDGASRQRR